MTRSVIPSGFWNYYPDLASPTRPPIPLGGAGGMSGCQLWRVESRSGPLAVRLWPSDGPDRARLDQIHRWLALASRSPFVATPIAGCDGSTWRSVDGRLWEVTPWFEGNPDLGRPPEVVHLETMFETLAKFHLALEPLASRGQSAGLVARLDELNRLIAGDIHTLRQAIDHAANDLSRPLASLWLDRAGDIMPRLITPLRAAASRSFRLQPCIRDVRPDHFLFVGDHLNGLVDFGAMGVDTVATDLARLVGETIGSAANLRRSALEAYERVRSISEEDLAHLTIFEAANALLGPARWVRWHYVEHRRFEEPDAVLRGLRRGLARLNGVWGVGMGLDFLT